MSSKEPMLEMFIFETFEMIEQLQQIIMDSEKTNTLEDSAINEIFRIMHTIKGSSGMMMFDNIAHISHTIEDIFYFIRESKPKKVNCSTLADLVLEGSDLIKSEIEKIDNEKVADGDFTAFIDKANKSLTLLKSENRVLDDEPQIDIEKIQQEAQRYYLSNDKNSKNSNCFIATLFFEENCEMENIRCFTVVHKLKEVAEVTGFEPEDIIENNASCEIIRQSGFKVMFRTAYSKEQVNDILMQTIFLSRVNVEQFDDENQINSNTNEKKDKDSVETKNTSQNVHKTNFISVDVNKLDKLMDLVGELVISEAMVTKNSELNGLKLDNFNKVARQHRKRLNDLQDVVMSIRMVSLAPTLNKMNRLVRDMCKKLNKEAELEIIGQETEVDKNIIEHIGDPLMHIVRNSLDHGIETPEERIALGKPSSGKIIIEAKNTGGEVWIIIKDNGKGLNKEKILKKAMEHGLIDASKDDMTDKDIYSLIFLPGFSTKDNVTEFSGRGVGMDVVTKEIEKIRGTVTVDSIAGKETTISIKIPLTLAIIDGMTIKVGKSAFTIPITAIRQSFIIREEDVIQDLDKKEMIYLRGECHSILRLHELYNIKTDIVDIENGIVIMVEDMGKTKCIFADELVGEQQVVIKALPDYIKQVNGVSGCTLLGDGSISLILDASKIVNM